MKKIKIAVIMGGKSSEHEISILSGKQIVNNLDKNKYEILPVVISKDGIWDLTLDSLIKNGVDVIFIALHGPYGEDGSIQGMFKVANIPYTGSGVLASALGMDKIKFRMMMKEVKIPIPKYIVVNKNEKIKSLKSLGEFPYFVKPYDQGSSVGASIAKNRNELTISLKNAFKYSDIVIIDEFIKGRELTCSILGNSNPIALPVLEIIPKKGEFFDYKSKYVKGGSDEIVPIDISDNLIEKIKSTSIDVYKTMGCRGFARVDLLLKNNNLYVLEINTIPGLTQMSLFPKSARAFGLTYSKLLDKIIKLALEKK
jgi:D-alanine-D-alanine ligase